MLRVIVLTLLAMSASLAAFGIVFGGLLKVAQMAGGG